MAVLLVVAMAQKAAAVAVMVAWIIVSQLQMVSEGSLTECAEEADSKCLAGEGVGWVLTVEVVKYIKELLTLDLLAFHGGWG
jgi:hypothetical protein